MSLKRGFRKLITFIVKALRVDSIVSELIENKRLEAVKNSMSCGTLSIIGNRASVINLQQNPVAIQLGNNSILEGELLVFSYGGNIKVGDWCFIGAGSKIWSASEVMVGNNVLISHNVFISDTNAHETDFTERADSYKKLLAMGHPLSKPNVPTLPIIIEDDVWINPNVCILKGVTIGRGAIIAAGAVVVKSVPPFGFVAGNPGRVIKNVKA